MPKRYVGSHDQATVQHPDTGQWIVVARGHVTDAFDGVDGLDLGPDWETPTPEPPPAGRGNTNKTTTPEEGDQ